MWSAPLDASQQLQDHKGEARHSAAFWAVRVCGLNISSAYSISNLRCIYQKVIQSHTKRHWHSQQQSLGPLHCAHSQLSSPAGAPYLLSFALPQLPLTLQSPVSWLQRINFWVSINKGKLTPQRTASKESGLLASVGNPTTTNKTLFIDIFMCGRRKNSIIQYWLQARDCLKFYLN